VGVASPGEAVLVADAGTAVTVDLVADGHFRGGNISPGLKLRFRSLNAFTSRLPLVGAEGELPVWGHDTTTAIRAGVVRGLVAELRAAFEAAAAGHDALRMTLTGGDAEILAPLLSQAGVPVSVDSQAVGRGLVRIFEYNKQLDQRLQG
jgi:type III pantothenate kinase